MNNNIAGTYSLPGIIFGSSGGSARTIGGNTIRFFDNAGTDPYISNDSSATHIFNLNIEGDGDAADPLLININSSGGLTFNGTINNQGSTINVQGSTSSSATVTMNGVISGTGGLYKANANTTLVLAGNNTYSGQTTIEGGTISITNASSLGSGTLQIGIAGAYSRLLVNSNSSRTQSLVIRDSATNAIIEVASGQTFTNSGTLSGTGSSTKFGKHGAGTLILSGSGSTYAGQMQIGGGTVILGQSGSFGNSTSTGTRAIDLGLYVDDATSSENVSLLASNSVTISNSIYVAPNGGTRTIGVSGSGSVTFNNEFFLGGNLTVDAGSGATDQVTISGNIVNTSGLIKNNNGILLLSGAGNTFTGGVTLSAGTLRLGNTGVVGSGTLTLNGGTLSSGSSTARSVTNAVTIGGDIALGASSTGTGTLTLSGAVGLGAANRVLTVNTNVTISGAIGGNSGIGITKQGTGTLTLSGANTFSGKVTISSGRLDATGVSDTVGSGLGLGTQVELGSGANLQVTVGAGTTNTTTRALIFNGSGTLGNPGSGTLVWNGNTTVNAATTTGINFNSLAGGTNVFGGVIGNTTNNSLVSLTFQNTQIWSLTGSNTFGGGITIGGGKVIADKLADKGTASSIGTNNVVRLGYFNNAPSTFEYVGSGSTNNMQVKLGASAGTGNNPGIFLQNGTGALVLTNANFTLASDVQAANMRRVLVLSGTNAADNTISGIIANADGANANSTVSIVKDGTGKWILSGANTYTGGTTISNGILQIGNGSTSGSVAGAITNNGTLILSRSGNPTISNAISGTGALIANNGSNNGEVTLSGASTFGGKVTVGISNTLYAMSVADTGTSALGTNNQVELLNGAKLYVNVAAGTTNTTARQLIVNGNFTIGNFSNGALVWNGNLVNNAAGTVGMVLGASGTGTNVFAGTIGNSTNGSALNITMTGASIWRLDGTNTFTGGVSLNDGKLIVSSLATNGNIGTGNFRMGGFANVPVLEYVGSGDTNSKQMRLGASSAATGGKIASSGTGALVFTNANFISGADVLTAGLNRAVILGGTNAADNAITGVIANVNSTNTVSIVKEDSGKWILSGANTYTGGTTVSAGTLQIGAGGSTGQLGAGNVTNNAALVFNRTGSLAVTNNISGTGTLTTTNSGTVTLSGANTFSGNVTVAGGALAASSVADSGSSSLGTGTQLTLGQGSSLNFTANSANSTARQLIVSGTTGTAWLRNSGTGAVVWSGNLVNQTTAGTGEFILGGTGTGGNEFAGLLTNNGANALRVIKRESGTWKLSGNNTFTGMMDIFNGTLVATTMANSGTASSIGAGTTIRFGGFSGETGVLEYVGSGSTNNKQFKLGGGGTANTGGTILNNGSGALVFTNATFNTAGDGTFANTTRALTLGGTNTADNAITGVIGDNNTGANTNNTVSIVKTDTGKWILSGANTYTGGTTISNGILQIGAGGSTGSLVGNITNSGTVTFNRSDDLTYGGSISGGGNFIKQGAGILTLTNAQTYTGTTTVSAGILRFNATNTSTTVTVGNNAKLGGSGSLGATTIQAGARLTPGNSPGNLTVSSLTLDAGSGYDWEISNVSGTAGTNWDLVTVTGQVTFNATEGNKTTIYLIGNPTGWDVASSYSWQMINAGSQSGFNAGNFAFDFSGWSGTTPTGSWSVTNPSGSLFNLNYTAALTTFNLTVAANATQTQSEVSGGNATLTGSGAALNKLGAGILVLTNSANSYTGTTTVKEGTLRITVAAPVSSNGALGNANSSVVIGDTAAAVAAGFDFGAAVDNGRGLSVVAGTGTADRVISTTIGSGTATQSGTVTANTNTIFSAASGGTLLVSGVISQGGALTISNSGTVAFTGINTYTNTTTILSGSTLRAGNNSALGTTDGNTVVNSGGTLSLSNGITTSEALNLNGTGVSTGGALRNVSGNNTVSGAVTLAGATRINADSGTTLTLTGGVTGSGQALTLGGAGNISISTTGINTSTSGVLTIDSTGVVTITASGNYTGATTLSSGTTRLGNASAFGTGGLSLNGGTLASDSGTARTIANNVTMGGNIILGEAATGTGALTLSGTVGLGSSTRSFTVNNTDSTLSGIVSGSGGITKLGTGNLTLSGVNTYSGTTTITAGKIIIGNNSGLGSGTVSLNGGALETDSTARTIANAMSLAASSTIAGTGALTVNGTTTVTLSAGLTNNSVGGLTLGNLTLGNSGVNRTLELRGTGNTTISGVVANSSTPNTGTLDIYSTGVTALNGANTYSGTTTVRSGATAKLGNASALGSTAAGTTVVSGGVLDLNGQTVGAEALSIGGTGISSGGALINSSANAASLSGAVTLAANSRVGTSAGAITLSGAIGGSFGLTKVGTGTVTLSGANTFSGGLTLSAGTLVIGNNAALGSGSVTLANGTTISGDGSARTLSNNIDFQNLTVGGSGALTLSGTLTHSRSGPSTLTNNNNSGLTLGAINLANSTVNRVVTFAGTGNTTVTGIIANGGSTAASGITLDAAGTTLTLSGANTYGGATTITAGTLVAANGTALGNTTGATTVADGAALAFSNNVNSAEAITISGTGVGGNGALRNVSGSNTNTGTVSLEASSTIKVDSGSTLQLGTINTSTGTRNLTVNVDGTLRVTGALLNSTSITNVLQKDGVGELVISNNGTTGGLQLQVANGKVTLAAGSFSTNTSTTGSSASPRAIDLGISSTGDSVNNAAFYANSGVTVSNSIYVAPNVSSALRTLGTESTSGTATFNREIYLGGDLQVSAASGGTAVFSGNIINSGALTKIGAGTVTLSGANTFGGNVTVDAGTLSLSGGSALNDTNAVSVSSGATLNLASNETVGSIAGAGNITLNANQIIAGQNNTSTTFSGVMSGTGAFVKKGSGTLTLSGANTISGQLYLVGGATRFDVAQGATFTNTINLGEENGTDNASLVLGGNGITLANPITVRSGSSNNTLSIVATNSTGTATLSGALTANKNVDLNVNTGGTLALSGNISGSSTIGKRGAGTAVLSGNNAGGLKYDLWAGELQAAAADDLGNNTGNFIGNKLYFDGGTLGATGTFTLGGANGITLGAGGGGIRVAADQTLTLQGYITDGSSTGVTFTKSGAGTLYLDKTEINDFSGTTLVVSEGTLSTWNPGLLSSTVQLGGSATTGTYRFQKTDGAGSTGVNFQVNAGGGQIDVGTDDLTVSGTVSGSGALTKIGSGRLTLSGNNSNSGDVNLNAGQLRLSSATAAGSGKITQTSGSSTLEINTTGTVANAMEIYNVQTLQTVTLSGAKTLRNATYDVATSTTTTESGTLSGDGGITKNGAGTLLVSGSSPNTFSGASAVNAGILQLQKSTTNAISGSSIAVNSGGTLLLGANNQISDTTAVTMAGGTFSLAGNTDTVGRLTVSANSIFDFGNTGGGTSTFTFADFDTAAYGNNTYVMTVNNASVGSSIVFNFNYNGDSTFNSFATKVQFGGAGQFGSISFGGGAGALGTTTLLVAIPDARVYTAAVVLLVLIGVTEYRRRRRLCRR